MEMREKTKKGLHGITREDIKKKQKKKELENKRIKKKKREGQYL